MRAKNALIWGDIEGHGYDFTVANLIGSVFSSSSLSKHDDNVFNI